MVRHVLLTWSLPKTAENREMHQPQTSLPTSHTHAIFPRSAAAAGRSENLQESMGRSGKSVWKLMREMFERAQRKNPRPPRKMDAPFAASEATLPPSSSFLLSSPHHHSSSPPSLPSTPPTINPIARDALTTTDSLLPSPVTGLSSLPDCMCPYAAS
jgi:hypothetical protein